MLHRSSLNLSKSILRRSIRRSPPSNSPFRARTLSNRCSSYYNFEQRHHFHRAKGVNPATDFRIFRDVRRFSVEIDKVVDKINQKFSEAREEIESAMESKETVYFNEEAECARAAVGEVLEMYDGLLGKLPENEKAAIRRAMGLKIEQLKAELQQLDE